MYVDDTAVPALLAKVVEALKATSRKVLENNDRATLTNEAWLTREMTDNATQESMRLGPRAAEVPSLTCWTGTSLDTAGMPELLRMQDQVPISGPILPP